MSLLGHITPFERFTNRRPDLSYLRVFSSHVTVKQPRIRLNKLDTTYTTTGIFLGYTATDHNIWFEDSLTDEVKSARHAVFNKANYSSDNRPPTHRKIMGIAEEHLVKPSITHPAATPTLPVHIIPDDTQTTPTTSNIPNIPNLPPPPSHRYPLRSKIMTLSKFRFHPHHWTKNSLRSSPTLIYSHFFPFRKILVYPLRTSSPSTTTWNFPLFKLWYWVYPAASAFPQIRSSILLILLYL
mmetsp:Transcript_21547/g.25678  ORF Transcript_21547/g.25678 Transcript_21547/m.25678 type:complete len:240 (+) Transcript_21547:2-721(+)